MLEFDLKLKEVPVKIGGAAYKLLEMNGQQRDAYLSGLANRMRFDASGKPAGFKSFDGVQGALVAACLRGPDDAPVPAQTIAAWPGGVVAALYEEARKLNGLDEKADDHAKND